MKKIVSLITALVVIAPPATAANPTLTVMSRNLYLGADVGVALELIPDMPVAAQFMWDQVRATDFSKRSTLFVEEINREKPDVIGLQEATIWYCKAHFWSKKTEVFNFTEELLKALDGRYVIAEHQGTRAFNPGYSIGPIPFLTTVKDPETFQPLFGSDKAACGFQIGDALLVKNDRAADVLAVGNSEYEAIYKVVPTLMEIRRGYTWADIKIGSTITRFVTTHLESLFGDNDVPTSALQAKQLITDLSKTKAPVIVMGDFNSDPRDPRGVDAPNPGGQPTANEQCAVGERRCNAYRLMRDAGFSDAGPDASDPTAFTWGMNALLTAPDGNRVEAAKQMGNYSGFTDRLDYIFLRNGIEVITSRVIGTEAPYASDHAGIVSELEITSANPDLDAPLDAHQPFPISVWQWIGLGIVALVIARFARRWRRKER
ncbi:MAG: endonuclease/exonuclease/phosphatase family protein [Candidatus Planktophila sp.]